MKGQNAKDQDAGREAGIRRNSEAKLSAAPRLQLQKTWEDLAREARYQPSELAKLCGVSLRTLQRYFKDGYNIKVSEWLRRLRMREAYERIRAGHRIKELAFDLGFKQLSHFSREFKEAYGVPPRLLEQSGNGMERFGDIEQFQPAAY